MNPVVWGWFDAGHTAEAILGAHPYFIRDRLDPATHDRLLVLNQLLDWAEDHHGEREAAGGLRGALNEALKDDDVWAAYDIVWCYLLVSAHPGRGLPVDLTAVAWALDELDVRVPDRENEAVAALRNSVRERLAI